MGNARNEDQPLAKQPSKKQKLDKSNQIYIIRWTAHGSTVNEWDENELSQIETCGGELDEAEAIVNDELLKPYGLQKDDGTWPKAYSTIEEARRALYECQSDRVKIMRDAIIKCCGINIDIYDRLLGSQEIIEKNNGEGGALPPPIDSVTHFETEIVWGATQRNYENGNEENELLRCCVEISTKVVSLIERIELVGSD